MPPRRAHLQNNQSHKCSDWKCSFMTSVKGAFHQFNRLVAPQYTAGEKGWTDMTSSHAWCIFRTNNQKTFGFRCKNWSISPRTLKTWKSLYSSVGQKKPTRLRGLDVSQEVYELCQVTFRSYSKTALLRNSRRPPRIFSPEITWGPQWIWNNPARGSLLKNLPFFFLLLAFCLSNPVIFIGAPAIWCFHSKELH